MTFPVSRQGLEQVAILLVVGALVFGAWALVRRGRGEAWRRPALSAGVMGGFTLLVLALAYTVAPNVPTPPVPLTARFASDPVPDTPDQWAAGRATFMANCAVCHGVTARGNGIMAPTLNPRPVDLTVHVPQHAPGELFYWIGEGVAGTAMPAWKDKLSEQQRWQVIRFLEALAAGRTT